MEAEKLNDLIKKYVNDSATASEREELLAWYRKDNDQEIESPYKDIIEEREAQKQMLGKIMGKIHRPVPVVKRKMMLWYSAAAALIVVAGVLGVSKWLNYNSADLEVQMLTKTKRGEHKKVTLQDGSVIWLSAESSLIYPAAFKGAYREVKFEGEAFFDITKDKAHPFIVHTGKTNVRVLGTTFNINSYKAHSNIVVSLLTGKVLFSDGKTKQDLLPGQQLTYTNANALVKVNAIGDVQTVLARKDGYYEYRNMRVGDVAEDVSRNFNVSVSVDGSVKDCLFYGRMKPGESAAGFLQKLAKVVNASVLKINNVYIVKGGGCN